MIFFTNFSYSTDKMDWWYQAKYGMFIHWGIYAVHGQGELAMDNEKIPREEYEKFASQFNPVDFNADSIALLAKENGMKYLIITAKHCDGFSMWDSEYTDYDIVDATPFKRDIIGELAVACHKIGIKFGVYYALIDWMNPLADSFDDYKILVKDVIKPQLIELVNKYNVEIIWFDGGWIYEWQNSYGDEIKDTLQKIKPDIILSNRLWRQAYIDGDFIIYEELIHDKILDTLYWETCTSTNYHWGYAKDDNNWKSPVNLTEVLIEIVSKGGNFLLNTAIDDKGNILEKSKDAFKFIGNWLNKYGDAIYNTKPKLVHKQNFGFVTHKDDKYFLIVNYHGIKNKINFPFRKSGNVKARDFLTGKILPVTSNDTLLFIDTKNLTIDSIASVIELIADGEPIPKDYVEISGDGSYNLSIDYINLVGKTISLGTSRHVGFWTKTDEYVYWNVNLEESGYYDFLLRYSQAFWNVGKKIAIIAESNSKLDTLIFYSQSTWDWFSFQNFFVGHLKLNKGMNQIKVVSLDTIGALINLTNITLSPTDPSDVEEPLGDNLNYSVFPNPSSNVLNIKSKNTLNLMPEIVFYDFTGKEIFLNKLNSEINVLSYDIRNIPTGIYLLKLMDGGIIYTKKFIKTE